MREARILRNIVLGILALAVAIAAFFIFYHPPMRLMPVPLLFQDGTADQGFDLGPALADGSRLDVFYATSRLPVGSRENRVYTVAPDGRLHVGRAEMRIGDEGSTLDQIYEWTTRADSGDRPFIHLERMNEYATLGSEGTAAEDAAGWLAEINAALAESRDKDILVYLHGANTTVERAAGQASQIRHFSGRDAVVVLFAWPTAENFLRYSRDIRNAIGSAPQVAELLELLADHTDAERINVFTYSAGATVGSDALALLARERPEAAQHLGEVYHAAPDADFRDFVDDLKAYAPDAERVTAAVNLGDSALRLAQIVNRGSRAGRPDLRELSPESAEWLRQAAGEDGLEVIRVRPEDMPDLSASSHTFWYDDPWVSSDVLVTLLFHMPPGERGLETDASMPGAQYWSYPPDFPDRTRALRERLLARLRGEAPAAP